MSLVNGCSLSETKLELREFLNAFAPGQTNPHRPAFLFNFHFKTEERATHSLQCDVLCHVSDRCGFSGKPKSITIRQFSHFLAGCADLFEQDQNPIPLLLCFPHLLALLAEAVDEQRLQAPATLPSNSLAAT